MGIVPYALTITGITDTFMYEFYLPVLSRDFSMIDSKSP